MKKFITTLSVFCLLIQSAQSEEIINKNDIKRVSIEADLGTNVIAFTFVEIKIGYRPPILDDNWDFHLAHSFNTGPGGVGHLTSLGIKHYFQKGKIGPETYLGAEFGFFYGYATFSKPVKGPEGVFPPQLSNSFVGGLGIGTDLNIIDNLQLTGSIYIGYPYIIRPYWGLKIRI